MKISCNLDRFLENMEPLLVMVEPQSGAEASLGVIWGTDSLPLALGSLAGGFGELISALGDHLLGS